MGPLPDNKNSSYCDGGHGPLECPPDELPAPPPPYPPPSPASHGRSTFVTALIIAVPVLAFLALCLSIFIFVRRRRLRRRQEALLEAALTPAAPATFPDDGPGEEFVHHVWHIRTVGLDEAAIESIALTRYRAGGGGVLGASDCTVCLGEFQDGELLRLLPKCAHAFHVQCIDTWLRAHVSCPLCRADVVMDPAAAAADASAEQPPGADGADASAEQPASNTRTMEQERHGQQANEQQELRVQIDQPDHSSSLDRPHRQIRHPGTRAQNFRRVASMDSPWPPTASAEEAPEDEQAGAEKQGTGGAVCCEVSPEPGHQLKRSLSASSRWTLLSRHGRARSSLLPL
ncbi:E3 ubiquitin-protein ligase RING1-like [Miscanthus floridulus]|uniref:E3 ubiquitin-protein ligase RING1-like n=1 Tax=Miscanthus floridulus TaxID=154761 RepID=UPI0034596736